MGSVLVVGSINADVVLRVPRRPVPGDTVLATSVEEHCGGKGANQAVAAARAGASVTMLGAVGDDARGRRQLEALTRVGVDTSAVAVDGERPTAFAAITVTPDGANAIVVAGGANASVAPERAAAHDVVVAQTEIPASAVDWAARQPGRFVLNTAPVIDLAPVTLAAADPLVVNEGEAVELVRRLGGEAADDPRAVATSLRDRSAARSVIVTLGSRGAVVAEGAQVTTLAAQQVDVVDTTGAGDVFVGTLAAALSDGSPLLDAARRAIAAASESVGRPGAR